MRTESKSKMEVPTEPSAEMTISAIIPTYNRASLVTRAIDSVLAQTRAVDEIIVVDDGSTDDTRAAIARYGTRVRYVYQKNAGLAASRNTGVRESRCEWVAFLDDDDEWVPEKIEKEANALAARPGSVLCYAQALRLFPDGYSECFVPAPVHRLEKDVLLGNPFTACSVLVRKDFFDLAGGFNPALRCAEDWEFAARMIALRQKFVAIDEPLVIVHETPNSMSKDPHSMLATELAIVDTLVAGTVGLRRFAWRRRCMSRMYYRAAFAARARCERYLHFLLRSVACWPSPVFEPRRYKALALHFLGGWRSPVIQAASLKRKTS